MSSEKAVIRFLNGQQTTETLTNSTKYVTPAQRGGHYVVVERIGNTEVLAKDVVAIREGNNLHLLYADGQVVLSGFYSEGAQSSIDLPADTEDGVYTLDSSVRGSAGSEAGGVELLHVQGEGESLLQMAAERPYLFSEQASSVEDNEEIEMSSSSSSGASGASGGSSYAWLAGLGLAGQAASFALASSDSSDSPAPELPTASITSIVNDTGEELDKGGTTSDITPTLKGALTSSLTSGQQVRIYDGETYLGVAEVDNTAWSYIDSRKHLDEAQLNYTAKVVEGQNQGASSSVFNLVIDLNVTSIDDDRHTITIDGDTGAADDDRITSDGNVRVTLVLNEAVTLPDDETLQVSADGGAKWVEATGANATGANATWETKDNAVTLEDGTGEIRVRIIDKAGNASEEVILADNKGSYTFDTSVRLDLAGDHTIAIDEDAGAADDDRLTNESEVRVTLVLDEAVEPLAADETPQVSADGGVTWVNTTGSGTTWATVDDNPVTLEDGTGEIRVRIIDKAGNFSEAVILAENKGSYTLDTSVTPQPAGDHTIVIAEDTGVANDDRITNESEVRVTLVLDEAVTLLADETLQVSADGGITWVDTTGVGTNWETLDNAVSLEDGTGEISVRIVDKAGNVTDIDLLDSGYQLDTTPPKTEVDTIDGISEDTGTDDNDFITSDKDELIFSISLSQELRIGEFIEYSIDDGVSWTDAQNVESDDTLVTSVTFEAPKLDSTATVQIRVSDQAGNTSAAVSQLVIIDTDVPTLEITSISNDTGADDNDFITNDVEDLTINANLGAVLEAGDVLEYSRDGGATWSDITSSVSDTSVSYEDEDLRSSATVQMRITDVAGNVSIASKEVRIDTAAPPLEITSISNDTGIAGDFITNDVEDLTINANLDAALQVGDVLEYSRDGGATWSDITGFAAISDTAVSYADAGLTSSATVQMRITDVAGNVRIASQLVIIDTDAPTLEITSISNDTGAEDNDFITNDVDGLTFSISLDKTLQAGDLIEYSIDDGASWTDATNVKSDGTSVTFDAANLKSTATVQMRITDAAGNISDVAEQVVTIDMEAPKSAPEGTHTIVIAEDTGVANDDRITNDNKVKVTLNLGKALDLKIGEYLEVSADLEAIADKDKTWVKAEGEGTTWATVDNVNLIQDTNTRITARIMDVAGNAEVLTLTSSDYRLDMVAPTTTVEISDISKDTGVDGDFVTSDENGLMATAKLSEELGEDEVLEYRIDGGDTWIKITSIISGDTSAEFKVPGLTSTATLEVRMRDLAGNIGATDEQLIVISPAGYIIEGQAAGDYSGHSVSSAGDVNGDGLDDIIVGAYGADVTNGDEGKSYVVFGRTDGAMIPLSEIEVGIGGFVIKGQAENDWSGRSVSSAGDVNGDGLDDLIIGARQAEVDSEDSAGKSYIVFGKADGTAVDLSAVALSTDDTGFVINGESEGDFSGWSVSSAGDVNGDGFADVVIGASQAAPNGGLDSGKSYIVFGKADGTAVDLSAVALSTDDTGFVINGELEGDFSGWSVSSAGDVNRDGFDDVIIGAYGADLTDKPNAGRSYVVFGKSTDTDAVNLSDIANNIGGFVINGEAEDDQSGYSVSSAGDVSGDGIDDLIIGTRFVDPSGGSNAGKSYVVFGRDAIDLPNINLSNISKGTGGFVINGEATADRSGHSVSSAGDVNGDGLNDLIVGAPYADVGENIDAGKSYIVFSKGTNTDTVDLSDIANGSGGFVINGDASDDKSGFSVSSAGDVNGDGLDDLIVGAQHADTDGEENAGKSYVVLGRTSTSAVNLSAFGGEGPHYIVDNNLGTARSEIILGGEGDDILTGGGGTDVILGGLGDDTILINASNLAALQAGFDANAKLLARVDGGGGIDTLELTGTTGLTLDLTDLADNRIEGIEIIDLTDAENHILTIHPQDLLDLSGTNIFNKDNGWGVLGAEVSRHQLLVEGSTQDIENTENTRDTVNIVNTDNLRRLGPYNNDENNSYWVYQDDGVQLLIDTDIVVNII